MARDVGARFNNQMGEIFVLPQAEFARKHEIRSGELMDIKCLNLEKYHQYFPSRKAIKKTSDGYRNGFYSARRTEKILILVKFLPIYSLLAK